MYQDIDKVNFKESGDSIYYINSVGCEIYITECELLKGSNYNFEKIPKIFYTSRVISIIKNKDQKCFIYCYIRKFLNNIDKHQDGVSLKDKQIVNKLEEKLNFNFDDVKIKDLSKIENLLETNIYVYTCDKNLKNRLPIYKSDKNYEKFIDLLYMKNIICILKILQDSFIRMKKIKFSFVDHAVIECSQRKNSMTIYNFEKQINHNYYYLVKINIYNLKIYKIQFNIIL